MIAVISYLEKEEYDLEIHKVLNDAFRIDDHYYISSSLSIHTAVEKLGSDYAYVNIQRAHSFKKAGYDSVRLRDFKHPENACYVFGSNYGKPDFVKGANVSIDIGRVSLHAVSALAMVLYDRAVKCRISNSV